jgi:hypothetical protein
MSNMTNSVNIQTTNRPNTLKNSHKDVTKPSVGKSRDFRIVAKTPAGKS